MLIPAHPAEHPCEFAENYRLADAKRKWRPHRIEYEQSGEGRDIY
jgi:hypothetical protein